MRLSDEELDAKVERFREKIKTYTDIWDEIPEERQKSLYSTLGQRFKAVGIYTTLRGDISQGKNWLEDATDWYLKAWEYRLGEDNEVQNLMWALLTSVLSRNTELMDTAAEKVDAMEFDSPAYFYQFDIALAGLIRDEDDRVLAAADGLDAIEDDGAPSELTYYGGLGRACRGIATDDLGVLDRGLGTILDNHEELIPKLGETMDDALVCYPATILLVLAAERRLPVQDLDCYGNEHVLWDLVQDG